MCRDDSCGEFFKETVILDDEQEGMEYYAPDDTLKRISGKIKDTILLLFFVFVNIFIVRDIRLDCVLFLINTRRPP